MNIQKPTHISMGTKKGTLFFNVEDYVDLSLLFIPSPLSFMYSTFHVSITVACYVFVLWEIFIYCSHNKYSLLATDYKERK